MFRCLALLVLASLAVAQSPAVAQSSRPATQSYHDEGLRFTYSFPADFVVRPSSEAHLASQAQVAGDLSPSLHCVTTAMHAVRRPAEHQAEMLTLVRIDFGCMGRLGDKRLLIPVAKSTLEHGLQTVGPPTLLAPMPYNLAGRDAVFLQGSAPDARDGIPGYAGAACVLMVNTIACWSTLTAYPTHLPQLFAGAIAFGGGPETPLVPNTLVAIPRGSDPR